MKQITFALLFLLFLNCHCHGSSGSAGWQMTDTSPKLAYKYVHKHSSAPTLLIVHGGPGDNSAYLLEPLGKELESKYNVIWFDQRGSGKSERDLPYYAYATTAHVEDIKRVQEAAGVSKVILVAHSWGGTPAGIYAARYPEKVKAFININGTGSFLDMHHSLIKFIKSHFAHDKQKLAEIKKIEQMPYGFLRFVCTTKLAREAGAYYKAFAKTKKEIADYLERAVASGEYTKNEIQESDEALEMAMDFNSLDTSDIYSILSKISAPTLIIAGKYDHVVNVDSLKKYQSAINGAKIVIFENSGHHPFQEEPEKFKEVIDSFIETTRHASEN